ncbi:hypothetical protein BH23BAC1_BH23BAC1_20210 [soil metagenome]
MKTTNFLKQIPGLLLIGGALVFSSCDNTGTRTVGTEDGTKVGTTTDGQAADKYEMTDADYTDRRNRVSTNLDHEIDRTRQDLDTRRQDLTNTPEDRREEIEREIERLEARIDRLEEQKDRLDESTRDIWEQTERDIEGALNENRTEGTGTETDAQYEQRGDQTGTYRGAENQPGQAGQNDATRDADRTGAATDGVHSTPGSGNAQ